MPDGWRHLDGLDLCNEFHIRCDTFKSVPQCIRGPFKRIQTQTLAHLSYVYRCHPEPIHLERTWKLFLLLPRLLLFKSSRGGEAGARNLQQRIAQFDAGEWDQLLAASKSVTYKTKSQFMDEVRVQIAEYLAEQGELSHAARSLASAGIAPGTQATFDELTDPIL